jgi:hypothetical protein
LDELPYRKKAMEGKRRGNGLRLRLGRKGIDGLLGSFASSHLLISSFSLQNYFRKKKKHKKALRRFATSSNNI